MDFKEYASTFNTVFTGNYKAAFEREVQRLISLHMSVQDRRFAIEYLCETYINETGERPISKQLDNLATHLLYESLEGDSRPDKMALEEYPIITPTQVKRRMLNRGESATDDAAFANIGNDGRRYGTPKKRSRRQYENDFVEKQAQDKAKKLNADYKKATSPSRISTLPL